jgi:hypothetical protein
VLKCPPLLLCCLLDVEHIQPSYTDVECRPSSTHASPFAVTQGHPPPQYAPLRPRLHRAAAGAASSGAQSSRPLAKGTDQPSPGAGVGTVGPALHICVTPLPQPLNAHKSGLLNSTERGTLLTGFKSCSGGSKTKTRMWGGHFPRSVGPLRRSFAHSRRAAHAHTRGSSAALQQHAVTAPMRLVASPATQASPFRKLGDGRRTSAPCESRDGLAMVDLYDATCTDRELVVTAEMG